MSEQEEPSSGALDLLVNAISNRKKANPSLPVPQNGKALQSDISGLRGSGILDQQEGDLGQHMDGGLGEEAFGEQDMINLSGLLVQGNFVSVSYTRRLNIVWTF